MKSSLFISILSFLTGCCISAVIGGEPDQGKKTDFIPPVEGVDISRYLGVWYEIARFPHRFEKDLVGVTATYSMKSNGEIGVLNQGYKKTLQGEKKTARGRARIPDAKQTGLLKVSFFWIFWADYKIIALDKENYSYALVTSSSKNYLWLLSRTPQMQDSVYDRLIGFAGEKGFDLSKLIKVQQP